jgi:hypothetical protein
MGVGGTAIQRIRYGLTGLAFVFLMVLIGTIVSRSAEEPVDNQVHQYRRTAERPAGGTRRRARPGAENEAGAAAKR